MAASTGPVLALGAISFANEVAFHPWAGNSSKTFQGVPSSAWKILPATAGLAVGLALLEKIAPGFATGLAWLGVLAILLYPMGTAGSPICNISKIMGY